MSIYDEFGFRLEATAALSDIDPLTQHLYSEQESERRASEWTELLNNEEKFRFELITRPSKVSGGARLICD
jgi:hypothetical protein